MTKRIRVLLVLLGLAPAAGAQLPVAESDFGFRRGAFLVRGMGARPVAMGEAFTAVADDATAIAWNPGGTGQLKRVQVAAQYDAIAEGMGLGGATAAIPIGHGQVIGAGITMLTYGSYEIRDAQGARAGTASAQDFAGMLSLALPNPAFLRGWTGVAVEVVREAVGGALIGGSAGGLIPVGPALTAGWAAQHFGAAADGFTLPSTVKAGIAYRALPRLMLALDAGYGLTDRAVVVAAGFELRPAGPIAVRGGYRHRGDQGLEGVSSLSAGAGVRLGAFGVDYAFQPFGELATSHRVSLLWGLGPSGGERAEQQFESEHALGISTLGPARKNVTMPSAELDTNAETAYREAVQRYGAGDHPGAVAKAEAAIALNPFHWQAWQVKGTALLGAGDKTGAIAAFRKSLELHADNPALEEYIRTLEAAGPGSSAAPAATAESEYRAGSALFNAGDIDGAWRKAAAALAFDPRHAASWQLVGNCQYAKGDTSGALASFRQALTLNPDNPQLKAFVGRLAPTR